MTRSLRAPVVLALASLSLGACTETKELGISVAFESPGDKTASALVEVTVFEGSCASRGVSVYDADVLLAGGTAAGPGEVESGPHAFYARAIAPGCTVVGDGCTDRDLPTDEATVRIIVRSAPAPSICGAMEECQSNGTCRRTSIPDASIACDGEGTSCESGSGTCHGNECCFGCWDGVTCLSGTTGAGCGAGGDACEVCGPGNQCIGSLCVPSSTESTFDLSTNAVFLKHESGVYYAASGVTTFQHVGEVGSVPAGMPGLGGFTGSLRFADVAGTQFSACGITVEDGDLWCWGRRSDGSTTSTPYSVADILSFIAIDGGDGHFCAIDDSDRLYCWGTNADGQLGTGALGGAQGAPVPVGGTDTWREVSALNNHTCAIRSDGALFCWGLNENGQLGTGDMTSSGMIRRVGTDSDWIHVAAGVAHTCGIRGAGASGSLYCWGRNNAGELGIGIAMDTAPHPTPVRVGSDTTWSAISAGQYHTCGLNGGTAQCWGANLWGELGTGDTMTLTAPTASVLGGSFTNIAASWQFTCGVRAGDTFYCWGNAGTGGFIDESMPMTHPSPVELTLF